MKTLEHIKAFNEKVEEIKSNQGDCSKIIKKIEAKYPGEGGDYYSIFTYFGDVIGIDCTGGSIPYIHESLDHVIGHIPCLRYESNNLAGLEPGEKRLSASYLKRIEDAYKVMAKEWLYQLRSVPRIFEILEQDLSEINNPKKEEAKGTNTLR